MHLGVTDSEAIANHSTRSLIFGSILADKQLNSSRLMKAKTFYAAMAPLGLLFFNSQALALPVSLGVAGNYVVLEIGNGNVSVANASNAGSIVGNVGVNGTGNLSDSGVSIQGNLVTSGGGNDSFSGGASVSGTTTQNSSLLSQAASAADAASITAAGLTPTGTSTLITNGSITLNGGTYALSGGVYDLTNLELNGAILDLTAGETYVFNITGSLALNSSEILDSTGADVLFNITGTQGVQLAGGLNNESVLDGIILAPDAQISVTPGSIVGELISGENINIASGGSVQGIASVPDGGSSLFLLAIGIGCLGVCGKFGHYRPGLRRSPAS
jgi:choice-of-anchor A domain-containing protein